MPTALDAVLVAFSAGPRTVAQVAEATGLSEEAVREAMEEWGEHVIVPTETGAEPTWTSRPLSTSRPH
jgi:predicted ArsR family transcriptional regulator